MSKEKTIITHDGLFHADDLFACAVLGLVLDSIKQPYTVIRTRNADVVATGTYIVDVGDIYDPALNKFDHHQKGGAGTRASGVPYASIGLVWKEYGARVCDSDEIASNIDKKLIQFLDADDNGVEVYKNILEDVEVVTIHDFLYTFRPTWKESPENFDKNFMELIPLVQRYITRLIMKESAKIEAVAAVQLAYDAAPDKRVIIMDRPYPADDFLISKPEPIYKISPNANGTAWGVKTLQKIKDSFENRKDLPAAWGGLRNEDLQKVSGVADAIFCHNALFLATAASKEGAIALAQKALENK